MADPGAADGLWNWCISGRADAYRIRALLAAVLDRPVLPLEAGGDAAPDAVLCDVWYVGGDFPTLVDCYLVPSGHVESTVARAVAVRLGSACLLPDDGLDPSRYLLAGPDGTLRPVHVDETETDDGVERRNVRGCTDGESGCACAPGGGPGWAPDGPRPAAAA